MNLFRSEEHARRWQGYQAEAAAGLLPLAALAEIWGCDRYRLRGSGHYISSMGGYGAQVAETLARVTGGSAFWQR